MAFESVGLDYLLDSLVRIEEKAKAKYLENTPIETIIETLGVEERSKYYLFKEEIEKRFTESHIGNKGDYHIRKRMLEREKRIEEKDLEML